MNPIRYDLLEKKKAILQREIKLINKIEKEYGSQKQDPIVQHALLHAMQNAIAAIIDISQHLCSEMSEKPLESYTESIERLAELGILPGPFAFDFARVAKLRNVMVHLYDDINFEFIWSLIPKFNGDAAAFHRYLTEHKF